jgi:hypothetical protein
MGEITLLSFLVGSLGLQTVVVGGWLHWEQSGHQRQCEEEEETLTPYDSKEATKVSAPSMDGTPTPKDPRLVGWEFKIVRANRDLFRASNVLNTVCDEEALAGWILLEKLDDRRLRFKRPIALREMIKPDTTPVDPYRTHYGPSGSWRTWLVAIASLLVLTLPAYLGYALVTANLNRSAPASVSNEQEQPTFAAPNSNKTPGG